VGLLSAVPLWVEFAHTMTRPRREFRAVVVANGELRHPERLMQSVDRADLVVAADGGANWLVSQGRPPDVLVGDMDSVSPGVLQALTESHRRLLRHSPRKDETDTELALLEVVAMGATHITVLGALGGRIDHTLANVQLLLMPQLKEIEARIFDGCSYLWIVGPEGKIRGKIGDLVSLIPLGGSVGGITTEGLEYPLRDETLCLGAARGVSNVLVQSEARITVRWGNLLVVHTPKHYLENSQWPGAGPTVDYSQLH